MNIAPSSLQPILKWPGGKSGELNIIWDNMPSQVNRYFEPFLGGGAVFLSIPSDISAFVNDKSSDLINLYKFVVEENEDFLLALAMFSCDWLLLQHIVIQHQILLLNTYEQYRNRDLSDSNLSEKIHCFIDSNEVEFRKMFMPNFAYDFNHFIKEANKSLLSKIKRMKALEVKQDLLPRQDILDNIEGALKAAYYTHLRHLYNYKSKYKISDAHYSALFYFIREYAYGSMFRFNAKGKFNIPYGGIGYNRKNFRTKLEKITEPVLKQRLKNTTIENMDFFNFLAKYPPQENDFIFLDPPYDTEFSSYDQHPFEKNDQLRLRDYLLECKAKYMLVIKSNDYINSLYDDKGFEIRVFDKKYMYNVRERNNRNAVHLMIMNYRKDDLKSG